MHNERHSYTYSQKILILRQSKYVSLYNKCPKINFPLNLFTWILIFIVFCTHDQHISKVYKLLSLIRQVFFQCFFSSLKHDFCIYVMHFVFNCITKPSVHDIMTIVHSFAVYFFQSTKAKMIFFSFKLTKVFRSQKRFILNFISTLFMRSDGVLVLRAILWFYFNFIDMCFS